MTPRKGRITAAAARRAEPDAPAPGTTARRAKPVRMTVEIPPALHRELTAWTRDQMLELDLTRLTISDAVRAMIRATIDDSAVSAAVVGVMQRDRA